VARGRLITIEGLDGAGKSTLAGALAEALAADGQSVELLREPGGVEVSERIRALVKDPSLSVAPRTEALLYAAAYEQLALAEPKRIRPIDAAQPPERVLAEALAALADLLPSSASPPV
jgi:dTMP kinase